MKNRYLSIFYFLVLFHFIVPLLMYGTCFAQITEPGPGDFGASADRVGFDNLAKGAAVTIQLAMHGMIIQQTVGTPLTVTGSSGIGGNIMKSSPYAVKGKSAGVRRKSCIIMAGPKRAFS